MIKKIKINKPIWIIGDVHGDFDKLMSLLKNIPEENPQLCFVGDIIDRGKDSKKVIDFIRKNNHFMVMGNHEEIMINGVEGDFIDYDLWMSNGGYETLLSYSGYRKEDRVEILTRNEEIFNKIKNDKEILSDIEWFKRLPVIIKFILKNEKPLYVSHSGFDIELAEKDISKKFILWNRKYSYPETDKGVNIFGHTITPADMAFRSKSHICIDSGGYRKNNGVRRIGFLTAIRYPDLKIVYSN